MPQKSEAYIPIHCRQKTLYQQESVKRFCSSLLRCQTVRPGIQSILKLQQLCIITFIDYCNSVPYGLPASTLFLLLLSIVLQSSLKIALLLKPTLLSHDRLSRRFGSHSFALAGPAEWAARLYSQIFNINRKTYFVSDVF